MAYALSRPELFTLTGPDGRVLRGGDQEWFRDPWQRRAGCGPTTAATVLAYLSRVHPGLEAIAPGGQQTAADFLPYMETLWDYVTPGTRGLDKAENFTLGCRSFALSRGCILTEEILEVPRKGRDGRPGPERCRGFLDRAFSADCPVAFLNYSNGDLSNLDSWHWVPLVALEEREDRMLCTVLDEGTEKKIDLTLWLETSLLGGALAVLFPAE